MKRKSNIRLNTSDSERWVKALSECRTCSHARLAHMRNKDKTTNCIDAKLTVYGKYVVCTCIEFQPKDNLEYLEWKYERANKRKKKK